MRADTYAADLAHLRIVAAMVRLRLVESAGGGFDLHSESAHELPPLHVETLARAGLVIGGIAAMSAEMQAAAAVAGARYGFGAGNRAQRRAEARKGGP